MILASHTAVIDDWHSRRSPEVEEDDAFEPPASTTETTCRSDPDAVPSPPVIAGRRTITIPVAAERSIHVVSASITELEVEAMVSSDDSALSHGGGVSWAIWDAAGPELADWAAHVGRLRLGDVVVSPAFALPARHLLHAITIDFEANRRASAGDVAALVFAVVGKADELGVRSMALPRLGSGAAGVRGATASRAIAGAVVEALPETKALREVVIAVSDNEFDETVTATRAAAESSMALVSLAHRVAATLGERGIALGSAASKLDKACTSAERSAVLASLFESALDAVAASQPREPRSRSSIDDALAQLTSDEPRIVPLLRAARTSRALLIQPDLDPATRAAHARSVRAGTIAVLQHLLRRERASTPLAASVRASKPLSGLDGVLKALSSGAASTQWRTDARTPGAHQTASTTSRIEASSEPSRPVEVGTATVTAGTEHVRALHRIILEHLGAEAIEALLASLDRYRGPPELRLLEYCTVVDDPAALLVEQFGAPGIRRLHVQVVGAAANLKDKPAEIAERVLRHIGFPREARPRGLQTELADILRARSTAITASPAEITGYVVGAGAKLEYLLRILLRFVCRVAFGSPPEIHFRRRGTLAKERDFARLGLGSLTSLVEQLDRELCDSNEPTAETYRQTIGATSLVPKGAGFELARARNAFAHFDRDADAGARSFDRNAEAEQFFAAAIRFLEDLARPDRRVFPYVIAVKRIEVDRFGRRTVQVVDDAGHAHQIFTSVELLPGRVYYMHPLTNPLRVDPLLVGAGDGED